MITKYLKIILSGLLLTLVSVVNAQTLGFKFINNQKRVRIPFELYNNLIVVPVILNNQLPLKFILDTGVRTTILTEKVYTDILNLSYSKKYTISGIGQDADQGIEAYITNGVSLTLPGVKGTGHAMLVLQEDYLQLRNYLGTEVHGILGYELFSRFVIKVDYDNKVLVLTTPKNFRPSKKYKELNLSIEDTKPYLTGIIHYENGMAVNLKLMVDSGASQGLMILPESDEHIIVPEKNVKCNLGRGLEGDIYGHVARLSGFEIGGQYWHDVIATFPDKNQKLDSIKGNSIFRNGSIGGGILSRFKVIFDFPEEKIYLKKGRKFNSHFGFNLSGLIVKASGASLDTYEIAEIRPGSVGDDAGFKVGDIIIAVGTFTKDKLTLSNIHAVLNSKANKKVYLEVKRNGVKYSNRFKLKSPI